jgi:hypothetical protein
MDRLTREEALDEVSYAVDDALHEHKTIRYMPDNARLVGWFTSFSPMFVAVWSYLPDNRLTDGEAIHFALDLLKEKNWFGDEEPCQPDYVI